MRFAQRCARAGIDLAALFPASLVKAVDPNSEVGRMADAMREKFGSTNPKDLFDERHRYASWLAPSGEILGPAKLHVDIAWPAMRQVHPDPTSLEDQDIKDEMLKRGFARLRYESHRNHLEMELPHNLTPTQARVAAGLSKLHRTVNQGGLTADLRHEDGHKEALPDDLLQHPHILARLHGLKAVFGKATPERMKAWNEKRRNDTYEGGQDPLHPDLEDQISAQSGARLYGGGRLGFDTIKHPDLMATTHGHQGHGGDYVFHTTPLQNLPGVAAHGLVAGTASSRRYPKMQSFPRSWIPWLLENGGTPPPAVYAAQSLESMRSGLEDETKSPNVLLRFPHPDRLGLKHKPDVEYGNWDEDEEEMTFDPEGPIMIHGNIKPHHIELWTHDGWKPVVHTLEKAVFSGGEATSRSWDKWEQLLLSPTPGSALRTMKADESVRQYPELSYLVGKPPPWGFVEPGRADWFTHVTHVVDEAAKVAQEEGLSPRQHLNLMVIALVHDLGDYERMHSFLESIGCPKDLAAQAIMVADNHEVVEKPLNDKGILALAHDLGAAGANIQTLHRLLQADQRVTPPEGQKHGNRIEKMAARAKAMGAYEATPEPLVTGRDLIGMGYANGPRMVALLQQAHEAQKQGEFTDHPGAMKWLQRAAG